MPSYLKTYATAAAREADTTLLPGDVHSLVQQLDTGSVWRVGAVNKDGSGVWVAVDAETFSRAKWVNPHDATSYLEWQEDGSLKHIVKGVQILHNK